jgi:hypothetical protein
VASSTESFRTLYCDPGEDFGWALGKGLQLLAGGTEKMWTMYDEVYAALVDPSGGGMLSEGAIPDLRQGVDPAANSGPIGRIVLEDWALYPWELLNMKWDKCRTARVIGGLTGLTRQFCIELIEQPAAIKEAAQAAGAEQLYYRPLKENRHANDAIQHFVYFTQTEMLGNRLILVPKQEG